MGLETFVVAMALCRNGIRVMVQITMRISGKGLAKKGIAFIRKELFGKLVEGVKV